MTVIKVLVCLANSYKHGGRCVAGIEIESTRPFALPRNRATWIRPVSDRPGHAVNEKERQYSGGVEPQVLDVVSVALVKHQPNDFQQENWLLDPAIRWQKVGRIGWDELCLLEQRPSSLWINGYHSYSGINDRVPVEQEHKVKGSLKLIRVDEVMIEVGPPPPYSKDGRPSVRARFRFAGADYSLKVTDPVHRERFRSKGLGKYRLSESFVTVSIAEKFDDGYIYKVVAGMVDCGDSKVSGGR
ncbi:dual OB domain-containing protein [Nocardia sp. N2S4-5]|uniref:dual OB domain-containing protein n=1 Tax=Nocardia sp. N2S4-5 TaxID=3351565 RepID=UPI0037D3536D